MASNTTAEPKLQHIDDFLRIPTLKAAYVECEGFKELYVRFSRRPFDYMEGWWVDIATVKAAQPGNGAFTALLEKLDKRGVSVYVENVLTERFAKKLEALGFVRVQGLCPSYFRKCKNGL